MTGTPDSAVVSTFPAGAGRCILLILLGIWIFGGSVFFFVRFGFEFYYANQASIDALVRGILE